MKNAVSPSILLHRLGVLVISGIVTGVEGEDVLLGDGSVFPKIRVSCQKREAERLCIRPGVAVIASTTDDFGIEMMLEGGMYQTDEFHVRAFTVRYNGCFDFEQCGEEKEQHVFAGVLLPTGSGERDGCTWSRGNLIWRHTGREECRNVVWWNQTGQTLDAYSDKRVIVVSGEKQMPENAPMPYYPVMRVQTI